MAKPTITLHWLSGRLVAVVMAVAFLTSAAIGIPVVLLLQNEANAALRTSAIGECDGTNLLRGDALLLIHHGRPVRPDPANLPDWLLRVRDCAATYDTGRIVIVGPGATFRYLTDLSQHHRVAVRDGGRRLVTMP